jgi:hypothetical protein
MRSGPGEEEERELWLGDELYSWEASGRIGGSHDRKRADRNRSTFV